MKFQALTTFAVAMLLALSMAAGACPGCIVAEDRKAFCIVSETGFTANCFQDNVKELSIDGPRGDLPPLNIQYWNPIPLETSPSIQLEATFFGDMTQLEDIKFTNIYISELDASTFFSLPKLRKISLENTGVQKLPEDLLARAHNLTDFRTSGNAINLPENLFVHNPFLSLVDLSHNRLTSLPEGLFQHNPSMESLTLYYNNLTTLPPSLFAKNARLERVYLDHNSLTSLPGKVFSQCPNLKWVSLWYNKLTTVPADLFAGNPLLKNVALSGNSLTSLPVDFFYRNTELIAVALAMNRLTSVPYGIFDTNKKLTYVTLSANKLSGLPSGLFDKNPLLFYVEFINNSLTSLPEGLFKQNPGLKFVHLSNNNMTSVSTEMFTENQLNGILLLKGNPLSCDCHFKSHVTLLSHKGWTVDVPSDCETKMNIDCCTKGDAQCS